MAKAKTNNKISYIALGISIVALIVAIFGLLPPKKHFGPKPGFNPHHMEQRADFRGRPDMRHNNRPDARKPGQANFRPDANRPMPKPQNNFRPEQPKPKAN